jgi:hypothetical protein
LLRISMPRRMRSRASVEKRTSLAAIVIHLRKRETACEETSGQSTTPRTSLSFVMRRSSPSIVRDSTENQPDAKVRITPEYRAFSLILSQPLTS